MSKLSLNKTDKEGNITGSIDLDIRVHAIAEPKGKTKAYASIGIDDTFGVHGVSIIEGKNGLFVSMPQTKDAKGEYRDIFHPVTKEGRKSLNDAVLAEFAVALEKQEPKKESTVDQIRDVKKETKEKASDKAADKSKANKKER